MNHSQRVAGLFDLVESHGAYLHCFGIAPVQYLALSTHGAWR
jgi:hypothetical protein